MSIEVALLMSASDKYHLLSIIKLLIEVILINFNIYRSICGRRVRVELSNASSRKGSQRGGPQRRGRPFHPEDKCYECGDRGHYARDCRRFKGGRRR